MKNQRARKPEPVTFREAANAWARVKWDTLSHNSVATYKPAFRRAVVEFGDKPLQAVTTRDVTAYLSALASKGYARRTVEMHRNVLSMIFDDGIRRGILERSPVDYAVIPRGLKRSTREPLTDEEIAAVKAGIGLPFGLFGYLLLYTGLRRGEALALRYDDIDREAQKIHIERQVEYVGNSPHIKEPKTASGVRSVVLMDVLADVLPDGTGYIFHAGNAEKPLLYSEFLTRWNGYRRQAGISATPHQFRHSYASMLYEADVSPKDAQRLLGHSKVSVTLDIYTHVSDRHMSRVADKLNGHCP